MPWYHEEETNTIRCVSEKYGRDLTIQLDPNSEHGTSCLECWRYCLFIVAEKRVWHAFKSQPDKTPVRV